MFKNRFRFIISLISLSLIFCIGGCGIQNDSSQVQSTDTGANSIVEEKKSDSANIVFSLIEGYDSKESKRLLILSDKMPESLLIVGNNQSEILADIYPYAKLDGKILGYAEISSLTDEGSYKVFSSDDSANMLAEVNIENNLLENKVRELTLESFSQPDAYSVYLIAESYELFPAAFGDDWGISYSNNGIPDVLDLIDEYINSNRADKNISYACVVSKFSYLISEFNAQKSEEALLLAKSIEDMSADTNIQDVDFLLLDAELFRITEKNVDIKTITDRLSQSISDFSNERKLLFCYLSYLNSSSGIDLDLADEMMKNIIQKSELVLNEYGENDPFFYTDSKVEADILEDMASISVTNHILPAFEYKKVIDSQMNFLRGLNNTRHLIDANDAEKRANAILIFAHLATAEDNIDELYAQEN